MPKVTQMFQTGVRVPYMQSCRHFNLILPSLAHFLPVLGSVDALHARFLPFGCRRPAFAIFSFLSFHSLMSWRKLFVLLVCMGCLCAPSLSTRLAVSASCVGWFFVLFPLSPHVHFWRWLAYLLPILCTHMQSMFIATISSYLHLSSSNHSSVLHAPCYAHYGWRHIFSSSPACAILPTLSWPEVIKRGRLHTMTSGTSGAQLLFSRRRNSFFCLPNHIHIKSRWKIW